MDNSANVHRSMQQRRHTNAGYGPSTEAPPPSESSISPKKRKRNRKGDSGKKFECQHDGCGKSYSRAEHLYRHQLNRMLLALFYLLLRGPLDDQLLMTAYCFISQQMPPKRFIIADSLTAIVRLSVRTYAFGIGNAILRAGPNCKNGTASLMP